MRRDFSSSSKQRLLNIAANVEKEKFSNIADWIGDQYYIYQSWIGKLGIRGYLNNLDSYQRKVIEKNNASKQTINKIFADVSYMDFTYKNRLSTVKAELQKWDRSIIQMDRIIRPGSTRISATGCEGVLRINEIFKALVETIVKLGNQDIGDDFLHQNEGTDETQQDSITFSDILEYISKGAKLPKTVGKLGEEGGEGNKELGLFGSIVSLYAKIGKAGDEDANTTISERVRNILDIFSGEIGIGKNILEIEELDPEASVCGIIGSSLDIYNELTKAGGRDVSDQLKNSRDLITGGGDIGEDIYLLRGGKEASTTELNGIKAIVTLFTMGTYAIGDVLQRFEDGVYNIEDYGETLLGTGAEGITTLVSTFTGGIIDIDTETSINAFHNSITQVQNFIADTGAPLPVQVAMAVPGTVIAAAMGVVGTFYDYGTEIGDNIAKFLWGSSDNQSADRQVGGSGGGGGR